MVVSGRLSVVSGRGWGGFGGGRGGVVGRAGDQCPTDDAPTAAGNRGPTVHSPSRAECFVQR
jgi:hypothetical protein